MPTSAVYRPAKAVISTDGGKITCAFFAAGYSPVRYLAHLAAVGDTVTSFLEDEDAMAAYLETDAPTTVPELCAVVEALLSGSWDASKVFTGCLTFDRTGYDADDPSPYLSRGNRRAGVYFWVTTW